MSYRREYARLPVINSKGPLPNAEHFRYKDQVLVRFISGWYTLGTIIEQTNHWNLGPDKLKYLYYRDVRHSHCLLLAGQGCDCPAKGGHKEGCKLITSGTRRRIPPPGPVQATPAQVFLLPKAPGAGQLVVVTNHQPTAGVPVPPRLSNLMPTMPWAGTGKPRRKPNPWRKRP